VLFSENAATPYAATVTINSMQYGVGYGTSKKQAKSEAARATLEILIPEMREKIQEDKRVGARGTSKSQDTDLSVSRTCNVVYVQVLIYICMS
jgi:microprocessor complex subunit DGCR8